MNIIIFMIFLQKIASVSHVFKHCPFLRHVIKFEIKVKKIWVNTQNYNKIIAKIFP